MAFKMKGFSGFKQAGPPPKQSDYQTLEEYNAAVKKHKAVMSAHFKEKEKSTFSAPPPQKDSPLETHEGPDKHHKQSKLSKLVEKGVELGSKVALGPIWGGYGKTPNIIKLRDLIKSKLGKKKNCQKKSG